MFDVVLGVMAVYAGLLLYFLIRLMGEEPEEPVEGGGDSDTKYQ